MFDDGSEWDIVNGWRQGMITDKTDEWDDNHPKPIKSMLSASEGRLRHELEQCEVLLGQLYNVIGPDAWPKYAAVNSWQDMIQTQRNSIKKVLKS
jgi:hypothetical protein